MVNDEVLGAMRSALERGESISHAIKTLRNARYKKEDIDEAASILAEQNIQPAFPQSNPMKFTLQKNSESAPLAPTNTSQEKPKKSIFQKLPKAEKQEQKISNYDDKKPKKKSKLIAILIFLLFFIAIILTTLFFFKDEIFSFLNKLF